MKKGRTDSSSVTTTEKPTGRISRHKTTTGAASIIKDVTVSTCNHNRRHAGTGSDELVDECPVELSTVPTKKTGRLYIVVFMFLCKRTVNTHIRISTYEKGSIHSEEGTNRLFQCFNHRGLY